MSELPDDAIGIYHRMFDFSGVCIPFSSFLLALIKHYMVYFSQLGPLGLNKVITFEVLCWSLQIEPTVTLFRVFQKLCKQGDWFSLAKRCAPSPVCIDDNRSCMKHWKSGFFLIDWRAIPDYMVWRHLSAASDDPRPVAGSFSMADVRRLRAHDINLRDFPEGVFVLSGLSLVWKSRVCDPVLWGGDGNVMGIHYFLCLPEWLQEEPHLDVRPNLQRLPFYCTPLAAADSIIPDPTIEDLAVGTPSFKILAKAKASHKRKASNSRATSSCVIPLVTPIQSAAVIPSSRNRGRIFAAPAVEGLGTRDSWGKGIMADDAAAPSIGGVVGNSEFTREEWDDPYRPTFEVLTKEVFKDLAIFKTVMSVLHCMMMSHGEELLARYRGLNQSHHEYVLSVDSRLKGYEEKVASLTRLERQVSTWKKQVSGLNDKLSSSDAFFEKSKAKGKERKKKIKSLTKSLDNLQAKVARLSADLNRATVLEAEKDEEILRELLSLVASVGFERGLSMHRTKDEFAAVLKKMAHFVPGAQGWLAKAPLVAQTDYAFLNKISEFSAEPLTVILQLELEKLVCPANFPTSKDARVSPPIVKESTVTPAFESFELSANVVPALSVVALEQNEEWGISHVLDDVAEVTVVGSGRVSSDLTDVVVALFAGEKGDGSLPSSATDEEAIANRYGFRLSFSFPPFPFFLYVVVHPVDPESCHPP
ncbi:hypothetical protein Tco_1237186 [Tanacetum coccineum]